MKIFPNRAMGGVVQNECGTVVEQTWGAEVTSELLHFQWVQLGRLVRRGHPRRPMGHREGWEGRHDALRFAVRTAGCLPRGHGLQAPCMASSPSVAVFFFNYIQI